MKNLLLKILMLDEHTLVHKSKLFGIIYIITAVLFAIFICGVSVYIHNAANDYNEEFIANARVFEDCDVILTDDSSCKKIVYFASQYPSSLELTNFTLTRMGLAFALLTLGGGITSIRYFQILKKYRQTQTSEITQPEP
ncbi:MAG: hypothetical protein JXR40_12050 [Pontiellaceae bacterium]|nr:hypothetical protein [Pontiellaceae bacterium]